MTLEEILSAYEDLWRQAALDYKPQGCAPPENRSMISGGPCAWVIGTNDLQRAAYIRVSWRCPICHEKPTSWMGNLIDVLVHLNDNHRWTWDMLANKTRDVLQQGGVDLAR